MKIIAKPFIALHRVAFPLVPAARRPAESAEIRYSWRLAPLVICLMLVGRVAYAQETYRQPPKEVLEVLHAPTTPQASISPALDYMLLIWSVRYPPISELSEPMLRLAGLRINPNTNGLHLINYDVAFTLKKIADGSERKVTLPPDPKLGPPVWSPDGKHFAFTNTIANGVELWIANAATGEAHKLKAAVNAAYGQPLHWMPDSHSLIVQLVPAGRGVPPAAPSVPKGPDVQESYGKGAPVATFEDMLTGPHDEELFDYYATSQLALINVDDAKTTLVGRRGIFQMLSVSPDGNQLLVARVHRPYSYLHPHSAFPKEVEVWDLTGKVSYKLASLPLADSVPIEGVPVGPRDYHWRSTEPATLVWVEALDGGDTRKKAEYRDRVLVLKAPFSGSPIELIKTENRFADLAWGERGGLALVSDYERKRRWTRTLLINADNLTEAPRLVWSRSVQDRYKDPGSPMTRELPTGHRAILQNGDSIYLAGQGASPEGDRPFLDRLDLKSLKTERIFHCDDNSYESVVAMIDNEGRSFITRRESPSDPPNYYERTFGDNSKPAMRALTRIPDPTPQLRGIKKQLATYKRGDGVQLSFTLYLPPNYKEGTRLPTVLWAYPLEYNDSSTASQVSGSTMRFTTIVGPSHLFFLLEGYAVLDNAAMPVVGDPDTVNNTYVEQIVMDARAAIDKAVEMGVTDADRVGVGGHSYGAFMTANLLAHSNLFRAGIARSGAYNRTLTPFGFQSERRTFWEAPDLYVKMSPFAYASNIKVPILMIHGEADNNSGTFPIQSERMYQAIRGNGGTVRLVMLPHEAHGYSARESVEHTLFEMIEWFRKYVKEGQSKGQNPQAPSQHARL